MDQMPSSTSSRPTGCCLSALAMNSSRFLRRMVPALVTRLTMKCPGDSTGGRAPVYSRGREGPLLGWEARSGWTNRLALQGLVHAFVGAVLVRRGWEDPLVVNAQAQPPHVELREPVNSRRGEGHAVVGANRAGQAILAKEAVEAREGAHLRDERAGPPQVEAAQGLDGFHHGGQPPRLHRR